MKKLAVIVPCYNEELVIAESYRRTREALHKLPVLTEIIYINDGSRDRTRLMLDEMQMAWLWISFLLRQTIVRTDGIVY